MDVSQSSPSKLDGMRFECAVYQAKDMVELPEVYWRAASRLPGKIGAQDRNLTHLILHLTHMEPGDMFVIKRVAD